ncbi:DnaJ family domain-containing protein [Mobilicoccus massiliensis]|uniref:DnaJ family domain-containing protein n=1 Tax=Mobilicoccus massiliensis TaxID=1522310 RepID=UPI00058E65E2|nr:DUF1992 domain-containing protein [Mobilicoccus massiliensis]
MTFHESWVERQIREATERGEFDNLPGRGKPLDLHDLDDPEWWTKRFLEREGFDASATMPPVMQLRAEHATFPESLAEVGREENVREILRDYNRRVVEDRLRPVVGKAMPAVAPRVDVEEMVGRWRELRIARESVGHENDTAPDGPPSRWRRAWWRRVLGVGPGTDTPPR